ncbi:hypothetical protein D3C81_2040060 [compost metagenome]
MESIDGGTIGCFEADGDTITDAGRRPIGRFEHEERRGVFTPDRAIVIQIGDAFLAECGKHRVVETAGLLQVVGTNGDVGEFAHLDALSL